jgi:chitinase
VTNCPLGSVVTDYITITTTYCPGNETPTITSTPIATSTGGPEMTTSTVFTTKVYTITSCAPTVTDCPAKLGHVTTEIVSLYTTVCPVAEATPTPGFPIKVPAESAALTTTLSSTTTQFITLTVPKPSATSKSESFIVMVKTLEVIPTPAGTVVTKPTVVGTVSLGTGSVYPTAKFTGAAGRNTVSGVMAAGVAIVAALVMV